MVVLILERVTPALRGELTRWLIEPQPGVFVGHVSGMVRERLWEKCRRKAGDGSGILLWSSNTEQRFRMDAFGRTRRLLVDYEGLVLVRIPMNDG